MAYKITSLGLWEHYTPENPPEGAPVNAMFVRRVSDGADWYEFARAFPVPAGALLATALPVVRADGMSGNIVQAVTRDISMIFPGSGHLLMIEGVDPAEEKPWKLFEQQNFDPVKLTIFPWPEMDVQSVQAVQAKIQLHRTPSADGKSTLLAQTQGLVNASDDIELQLWFAEAANWRVDDPNVQKLGAVLKFKPEEIQALLNAASKIGA